MRGHAKASSAGSIDDSGNSRGLFGGAFVARGGPGDSKGSGAPSIGRLRDALAVLALAICALALTAAPAFATPLGAKIGTASSVLGGSAHVTGEIDPGIPNGSEPEAYFTFEYSTDGVNWSGFNFEGYATGEGFRPVSADLKGLKGGTKYFVRLFVRNFVEPDVSSSAPNLEFETLPVTAPSVLAIDNVSQVGFTTAKVSGEVLRPSPANPDPGFDAKCSFEYVTDAQFTANVGGGGSGFEGATLASCNHDPVKPADGAAVETILTGLAPATTYHLRLSASNAGGADSKEAASTFTTQAIANAPALAVKPAAEVQYSKAQISGTVNPNGGNVNPVGGPVPINWELQYTRADEPASWQLAGAGTIEGAEAESSSPIAVPASPQQLEGLHSGIEYKVRLIASYAGETAISPEGSLTTEAATAPSVTVDAATLITTNSAHFSGHVNPGNEDLAFNSFCEFDYASQKEFDNNGFANVSHVACDVNPVSGTVLTAVQADPTDLEPGTVYHLRIRAENQGGTSTAVAATSFETDPIAPLISATAAHNITTTAATLNAQVNPGGDPTTYHFEYLSAEEFEAAGEEFTGATSTPESAAIGEDAQNHPVATPIEGLAPDTAYRFRLVATNPQSPSGGTVGPVGSFRTVSSAADACPNAAVRSQQGTGYLPDCRAYEQASPVNKHGYNAGLYSGGGVGYAVATADGDGVLYVSGPMGDATRGLQEYSASRRQADGSWSTRSAVPGGSQFQLDIDSHDPFSLMPSPDLSKLLFTATVTYMPDGPALLGARYAGFFMGHADGSVDWLSRPQIPDPLPPPGSELNRATSFTPVGASPDFGTVYFLSEPTLLPADKARTEAGLGGRGLYEYSGGVLKPAGTLPDGTTESPGGAAPANSGSIPFSSPENFAGQVSRDGSTLWFVSPDRGPDPKQLYVRRGGHSTLVSHLPGGAAAPSGVVSVPGLTANPATKSAEYAYGSADGKTAIFQSKDALTPDAPSDSSWKAYRYDVETDTVSYLLGVGGYTIVAATDDLRHFLFGSPSEVVSGKIAVWDEGTTKTIYSGERIESLSPARANASGSVFVFTTNAQIPGFNRGNDVNTLEIYRYDVAREKLSCVSCPPDDIAPSGDASLSREQLLEGELVPSRGISTDGTRVFFDTPDPLVPQDTNGVRDVYEWTPERLSLISGGHSPKPSFFLDNSANGDDVFFDTKEGLDPADTDDLGDVFDAHVNGGFLRREVTPCVGEECRASASAPAAAATAASASFSGASNQVQGKPKHSKGHKKKHHKKKSHKRAGHNRGGSK